MCVESAPLTDVQCKYEVAVVEDQAAFIGGEHSMLVVA